MEKTRDVLLIIITAAIIFFVGSKTNLSEFFNVNDLDAQPKESLSKELDVEPPSIDETNETNEITTTIEVTVTPDKDSIFSSGAEMEFIVTIKNLSDEPITIEKLTDSVFGELEGDDNCKVGSTLKARKDCTFTFVGSIKGKAGDTHTNTVVVAVKGTQEAGEEPVEGSTSTDIDISASIVDVQPGSDITLFREIKNPLKQKNEDGGASENMQLIIWDQSPENLLFVWGPVSSNKNSDQANLVLKSGDATSNIDDYNFTIPGQEDNQNGNDAVDRFHNLTIGLDNKELKPGDYASTIFLVKGSDKDAGKITVNVQVGFAWWWIVLTVALGVVATRIIIWWGDEGKYNLHWRILRVRWIDLVSERFEWAEKTNVPPEAQERDILQIRKDIKEKVSAIGGWLNNVLGGLVEISKIKDVLTLTQSLDEYLQTYLKVGQWKSETNQLNIEVKKFFSSAVKSSQKQLKKVKKDASTEPKEPINSTVLYGKILTDVKKHLLTAQTIVQASDFSDVDKKAVKAENMGVLGAIITRYLELARTFKVEVVPKLDKVGELTEPKTVAEIITSVDQHLNALHVKVIKPGTSIDLKAWAEGIDDKDTKLETLKDSVSKILNQFVKLEKRLDTIDKLLKEAKFPSKLKSKIETITGILETMGNEIPNIGSEHISETFLRDKMFAPILMDLVKADKDFNKSEVNLAEEWKKHNLRFGVSRRIVKAGRGLFTMRKKLNPKNEHIVEGYTHLLDNTKGSIEAEVQYQRSKYNYSQTWWANLLKEAWATYKKPLDTAKEKLLSRNVEKPLEMEDDSTPTEGTNVGSSILAMLPVLTMVAGFWFFYTRVETPFWKTVLLIVSIFFSIGLVGIFSVLLNDVANVLKPLFKSDTEKQLSPIGQMILNFLISLVVVAVAVGFWVAYTQAELTFWKNFWLVLLILYLLGLIFVLWNTKLKIWVSEFLENFIPAFLWIFTSAGTQLLTILVASILVIYGYNQFDNLSTWGSPGDFVIALAVGILSDRLALPTKSLSEMLNEKIKEFNKVSPEEDEDTSNNDNPKETENKE